MVGRVRHEPAELLRIGGCPVLVVPALPEAEPLVPRHVEQWRGAHSCGAEVWPLGDAGTNQQPAVRSAPHRELIAGRPAIGNELLGSGVEVIEDVLLALAHARAMPLLALL